MWVRNVPCIDCSSSDALSLYRNDGIITGYCNSSKCEEGDKFKSNRKLRKSYLSNEMDLGEEQGKSTNNKMNKEEKVLKSPISKDMVKKIIDRTSAKGSDFRSIPDDILKYYLVRTEYDEEGEVLYRYYPVIEGTTSKGKPNIVGFKQRVIKPKKSFRAKGRIDATTNDLFGEWRCKGHGKYILLTSGEEDVMAAKAMIRQEKNEDAADIDVVCSTISETGQIKQIQRKYEFFDGYDNIIIAMDMDSAGENATEKLLDVLPTYKTKVMYQPANDANQCLEEGLGKQWLISFYQSFKPKLSGIVSSIDVHQRLLDICDIPSIPLPPFMKKANEFLCGGLPRAEITNILAGSGTGKTTIVNEFVYYWLLNSPAKVGILSMEASSGKYFEKILSRHIGVNISRIVDKDEDGNILPTKNNKRQFLSLDSTINKTKELTITEDNNERFSLIDERGDLETMADVKKKITQLIRGCGCQVVIIDPVTDLLDSLPIEQQAEFCGWMKKMKSQGTTFILINHARKGSSNQKSAARGAELDEQDIMGTSALYKSAAVNIILSRDKEAEDETERNTTRIRITKNRDASTTGPAGEIYYQMETHRLYDKEDWVESQIGEL